MFFIPPHMRCENKFKTLHELLLTEASPDLLIKHFLERYPQRRVVSAATVISHPKFPGGQFIVMSARHHDVHMNNQLRLFRSTAEFKDLVTIGNLPDGSDRQGFVDQWCCFMSRQLALKVAIAAGQPINYERNQCNSFLHSEGLY